MISAETRRKCDIFENAIRNANGGYIKADDLCVLMELKNRASLYNFVLSHKNQLPMDNIKSSCRGYTWAGPVGEEKMKDEPKEKPVNSEGYSDPTASKAIGNLKKYFFSESDYLPGVVYATDTTYFIERLVLVLSGYPGSVNCLEVKEVTDSFFDSAVCIKIEGNEKYYVDPRRVVSISEKRFKSKKAKFTPPMDWFNYVVKSAVADYLGLSVVEKTVKVPVEKVVEKIVKVPVEKVVEKIVEVPVEKVVTEVVDETRLMQLETDLRIAEEIGKIWQKALYAVTGYKEGDANG